MSYYGIILAGGKATRFQGQLKHFCTIDGVPLLIYIIKTILKTNVKKIFIIVSSLWKQQHFNIIKKFVNQKVGVKFILQKEACGAAKAVELIFKYNLDRKYNLDGKDNLLIFCGDSPFIQCISINNILKGLKENYCIVNSVISDNTSQADRLLVNKDNKVISAIGYKIFNNDNKIKNIELCAGGIIASKVYILKRLLPLIKKCEFYQEYRLGDLMNIAYDLKYNFIHLPIEPYEAMGCNNPEELKLAEEFYQKNLNKFIK